MMEPNEIAALKYCAKDIRSKVLVTTNVLRKLHSRKMLSKKEEENLKHLIRCSNDEGSEQNSKLLEIIINKNKPGAFQAFTEALLLEKRANEHYVIKMRIQLKKLNLKQRVVPEDTKHATHVRELEQKVNEYKHLFAKVGSLVLGLSATLDDEEDKNMNATVNELEETRKLTKMREKPISDTFHACRVNFEKVKTDLAQKYEKNKDSLQKHILQLKEEIKMLKRKIAEIQSHGEEIIRDKVDVQVRERLVRLHLNDTTVVEPNLTLNPNQKESENDPLKEDCPMSHQTDLSIPTQQPPNGQPIQIQIRNLGTLQINKDGNNIALPK